MQTNKKISTQNDRRYHSFFKFQLILTYGFSKAKKKIIKASSTFNDIWNDNKNDRLTSLFCCFVQQQKMKHNQNYLFKKPLNLQWNSIFILIVWIYLQEFFFRFGFVCVSAISQIVMFSHLYIMSSIPFIPCVFGYYDSMYSWYNLDHFTPSNNHFIRFVI